MTSTFGNGTATEDQQGSDQRASGMEGVERESATATTAGGMAAAAAGTSGVIVGAVIGGIWGFLVGMLLGNSLGEAKGFWTARGNTRGRR